MEKLEVILAINDREKSAEWYQQIFNFRRSGKHPAALFSENNRIVLFLHP